MLIGSQRFSSSQSRYAVNPGKHLAAVHSPDVHFRLLSKVEFGTVFAEGKAEGGAVAAEPTSEFVSKWLRGRATPFNWGDGLRLREMPDARPASRVPCSSDDTLSASVSLCIESCSLSQGEWHHHDRRQFLSAPVDITGLNVSCVACLTASLHCIFLLCLAQHA